MNPRAMKDFLTSKFGLFVLFVVALFTGLFVYGQHRTEQNEAARLETERTKKAKMGQMRVPLTQGLEDGTSQRVQSVDTNAGASGIVVFRPATPKVEPRRPPDESTERPVEKPGKVRYATLLAAYEAPREAVRVAAPPPNPLVPYGTLMKCKLVNTIDSGNLETPVIALLLEDIWQNGEQVIPANTLVHGAAKAGRLRDRVTASGSWRLVWQDGRELAFTGIALDREYDHEIDGYGITDGSAGLKGRLLASDDLQELKVMASAALSGFARGTQDRTQTALGSTITGSISNGAREGMAEVFDLYAHRVLRDIEENGYFVRVAAGKEFYVYVGETIDPAKARMAGVKTGSGGNDARAMPQSPRSETDRQNKG